MTGPSPEIVARRTRGLRGNALAAVVMLLVQYALGMWVALYGAVPGASLGKPLFGAFGTARLASRPAIPLTAVGLLAIVVAWIAGSRYVANLTGGSSFTMALATAAALLAYVLVIFAVTPPPPSR